MLKHTLCLNGEWDFMPLYGVKSSFNLPEELNFEERKITVPSSWRFSTAEGNFGVIDDFQPYNNFNYPIK
jgi:beta-galactosidase